MNYYTIFAILVLYCLYGDDIMIKKVREVFQKIGFLSKLMTIIALIIGVASVADLGFKAYNKFTPKCSVDVQLNENENTLFQKKETGEIEIHKKSQTLTVEQVVSIPDNYLEIIPNKNGCINNIKIHSIYEKSVSEMSLNDSDQQRYGMISNTNKFTSGSDNTYFNFSKKESNRKADVDSYSTLDDYVPGVDYVEFEIVDPYLAKTDFPSTKICDKKNSCYVGIFHDTLNQDSKSESSIKFTFSMDILEVVLKDGNSMSYVLFTSNRLLNENVSSKQYLYSIEDYSDSKFDFVFDELKRENNVYEMCKFSNLTLIESSYNYCNFYYDDIESLKQNSSALEYVDVSENILIESNYNGIKVNGEFYSKFKNNASDAIDKFKK